jgi:uncharacterized membrane protein (UPF0127 family)
LALALLATAALGCDRQPDEEGPWISPIAFDTAVGWVHSESDSTRLLLELARSESQQQFGLMTRPALDAESGMAFLYDSIQPGSNGFWMYRTRVPLDIAFLDSTGVIRVILPMEPCPSPYPESCPTYAPGLDYWSAVEVNRGWFERHGVGTGGRIRIEEGVP